MQHSPKGLAVAKAAAKPAPAPPAKPVKVKSRGLKEAAPAAPAPPPAPEKPKAEKPFAHPQDMLPTTSTAVVNNLMSREIKDPTGHTEPVSETVRTLARLSQAVSSGNDIGDIKSDIIRIVSHQPEKADVFQSVLNLIDQERTSDMVEIRAVVEKVMKRSALRGDLSTSECLAVWHIANEIIRENQAKAGKFNKAMDTITVVEKVDLQKMQAERVTQQKWEGTTPQGRQIIRMKLFDLKRVVQSEKQAVVAEVTDLPKE